MVFSQFGHVTKLAKYDLTIYYYWYKNYSIITQINIMPVNSISYNYFVPKSSGLTRSFIV